MFKKKTEVWIWGGSTSVRSQKGGVHMVAVKNGGGVSGCKQNWGGWASGGRRPPISYTPPLRMILTASLSNEVEHFSYAGMRTIVPKGQPKLIAAAKRSRKKETGNDSHPWRQILRS